MAVRSPTCPTLAATVHPAYVIVSARNDRSRRSSCPGLWFGVRLAHQHRWLRHGPCVAGRHSGCREFSRKRTELTELRRRRHSASVRHMVSCGSLMGPLWVVSTAAIPSPSIDDTACLIKNESGSHTDETASFEKGFHVSWGQQWAPYVSVGDKLNMAVRHAVQLAKKQKREREPVSIEGRAIAKTFWGKAWCDNLTAYQDYSNRLPRGATYVRNGSVVDLIIKSQKDRGHRRRIRAVHREDRNHGTRSEALEGHSIGMQ